MNKPDSRPKLEQERPQDEFETQQTEQEDKPDSTGHLRQLISGAAADQPDMTAFVQRLELADVRFIPTVTSSGRVTRVAYGFDGRFFNGSELGRDFTWSGLRKRLGIQYDEGRDLRTLTRVAAKGSGSGKGASGGEYSEEFRVKLFDELEKIRRDESEHLAAELARLRNETIWAVSAEVKKVGDQEQARLLEALAPLSRTVEEVRENTSATLQRIEQERKLTDKNVEKTAVLAAKHMVGAADRVAESTQKAIEQASASAKRVEEAAQQVRKESFAMAGVAAVVAALIAALLTGLWMSEQVAEQMSGIQQADIVAEPSGDTASGRADSVQDDQPAVP